MNEKLILGTVQFGLDYGINNKSGQPSEYEIDRILDTAWERGIRSLDTAEAYGDANSRIGYYHSRRINSFKIQGKVHNLGRINLRNTVITSLEKLCVEKFSVLSLHSFTDYINFPECIDDLLLLKEQGLIERIGISVYTNQELEYLLKDSVIDVVQFPYNILDNENLRGELMKKLKINGKIINVRSVFLQGLFFVEINRIPDILKPIHPYVLLIKDYCRKNSKSISSIALSYVFFNSSIDKILIGVDSHSQLTENLNLINYDNEAFNFIKDNISVKEIELLNPVNWK